MNMSSTNDSKPLWLDLRTEYIDDNIDKLQDYLGSTSTRQDLFYQETLKLLEQRVSILLDNLARRKLYEEESVESVSFNVRLLAIYILSNSHQSDLHHAYISLLGELQLLHPRLSKRLVETAVRCLTFRKIDNPGFGWQTISDMDKEYVAFNLCSQASFSIPLLQTLIYEKHGTAVLTASGLYLSKEGRDHALKLQHKGAASYDTGVGVTLRTPGGEKLKQSSDNNVSDIADYTQRWVNAMLQCEVSQPKKLPTYADGDSVLVRLLSLSGGRMVVETTDPAYTRLKGEIVFEHPSLAYYYTSTLYLSFIEGDYFLATVTDSLNGIFSIEEDFIDFFVEEGESLIDDGSIPAKVVDVKPKYMGWITKCGVCVYTDSNNLFQKGDYAMLRVTNIGTGSKYGKIYADVVDECGEEDVFDEKEVRHECLRIFADSRKPDTDDVAEFSAHEEIEEPLLQTLTRMLFVHQKTIVKPSEKYKIMSLAYIIATLIDNDSMVSYIRFASTYLNILIRFVNNQDISTAELQPQEEYSDDVSTMTRMAVVQLLKEYGGREDSEVLTRAIRGEMDIPLLSRIARLIQAANSMRGTLSDAVINIIRREIIKTLSLETENEADLEDDLSTYLGIESGTQEFKTSMIYPSDNKMQPDEQTQNYNVMKGICAFLNSTTSGTLYIGVNDLGYVSGIASDMNYLKCKSIDTYLRYVQDKIKRYLGIDALPFIRIEALYDDSVVAVHIDPHPYRVVELNGVAYLRMNAESRVMDEDTKQQHVARKMLADRNQAAVVSHLLHACETKRCAILHNYSSSSSGVVSDRLVEPYDVRTEDTLVVCYERNSQSDVKVKCFSLNRIGYVDVLNDEPWMYESQHKHVNIDAYHMTGSTPIQVSLKMDLYSKNLLVERYPKTRTALKRDRNNENIWYYSDKVNSIAPVAQFYLGLADRIEIVDCPELEKYVKEFVEKHLLQ